jgi:hypothetical protein
MGSSCCSRSREPAACRLAPGPGSDRDHDLGHDLVLAETRGVRRHLLHLPPPDQRPDEARHFLRAASRFVEAPSLLRRSKCKLLKAFSPIHRSPDGCLEVPTIVLRDSCKGSPVAALDVRAASRRHRALRRCRLTSHLFQRQPSRFQEAAPRFLEEKSKRSKSKSVRQEEASRCSMKNAR